jgi:hypothetical protein
MQHVSLSIATTHDVPDGLLSSFMSVWEAITIVTVSDTAVLLTTGA